MQIIYLDTLFFLNATVDYLLLLAAARVAGERLPRLRFAVAGVLGGLYAVFIFWKPIFLSPWCKTFVILLMIFVAYGGSRHLIRQGLIFLALSFAFAGGVLAVTLLGGQHLFLEQGVVYAPINLSQLLAAVVFCYIFLTVVFQNFGKHSNISGELVSVVLTLEGKEIPLTVLVDTGNTLQDPISGQGILVAEGALLSPFFEEKINGSQLSQPSTFLLQHPQHKTRMKLLPYQAVGVQGILLVLRVDKITVNQEKIPETLVALSPTAVSDGGSYHGLIGTFLPVSK